MKMLILVIIFALATLILPVLTVFNFIPPVIYLVASLGVGMSMVIFIIVIYVFTRGILEPALAARMGGKAMWVLVTATRRFVFAVGDVSQRLFQTKNYGDYIIDPDASFMWPHGVTGAIATTSRASSLSPDMVKAASAAKEYGMKSYKDLEEVKDRLDEKNKELELLPAAESTTGRPLRLNDIIGFFKHNLNPSYIQSVIKLSVAKELEGRRQFPTNIIIVVGILLVCAGVAYTIIVGAQSSNAAAVQLGQCQNQLAQYQSKVVATTTTTSPTGFLPILPIQIT